MKTCFSIGKSNIVHRFHILHGLDGCFYVKHSDKSTEWTHYKKRPSHMRVCDECQRLEMWQRLKRKAGKP